MDKIVEFLTGFDVHTIITSVIVMWYFARNMKNDLKQHIDVLDKRLNTLDGDVKEVSREVRDINVRVGRLEGAAACAGSGKTRD